MSSIVVALRAPPPGSLPAPRRSAEISEEPGRLTAASRRRRSPAPPTSAALDGGRRAGGASRRGRQHDRPGGDWPPFVLGSHLDTVPNAGRYDGPLGILAALAVVERLAARGDATVPLEVAAFADEEGTRFGTSYLGSAAYTGGFEREWLDLVDADGITVADAILAAGGDPEAAVGSPAPQLAGYLEVHIEQGPVLEREGVPVGVVTAIAGQSARVSMRGEPGHAGTVPMSARRDALAASAEVVLAAEQLGEQRVWSPRSARCRFRRTWATSFRARRGCCSRCATRRTLSAPGGRTRSGRRSSRSRRREAWMQPGRFGTRRPRSS